MPVTSTSRGSSHDIRLHVLARCPKCGSGKVDYSFTGFDLTRTSVHDVKASLVGCDECGWVGEEAKALP